MNETQYESQNNDSRPYQVNQKAWLIWNGMDDCCPIYGETFVCLDEDTALELYMALVEEEIEETFFWITQDEYEPNDEDWEWRTKQMSLRDTLWCCLEVAAIGNLCR